jgi:glycosyltransferase involved in cell wall biosynthesis
VTAWWPSLLRRPAGVRARLRRRLLGPERLPVVLDAAGAGGRRRRAALLVYLPDAFLLPPGHPRLVAHQNLACCRFIAAVLDELGFVVDVVHRRDDRFRPPRDYDLVVSERLDWSGRGAPFEDRAVTVFHATSLEHGRHNRNVVQRHERLARRRGCSVRTRRVYSEVMPAMAAADALITIGNGYTVDTWREVYGGPAFAYDNYALPEAVHAAARGVAAYTLRNFLFVGSRTQLQKGLDLLLEVFADHPELHLYVCGEYEQEPDFCRCYRRELYETPNIHALGWVRVDGPLYRELVRRCAFVVYPSASEGQAGSVVNCIASGLVPLVSRETGLDVDGFGTVFRGDALEEIERVVVAASALDHHTVEEQSAAARRVARTRHSEEAFRRRWREILEEVLA